MANRFRPYLSKLVSYHQSTFVPGRNIWYNYCIAVELIHCLGRKNRRKRFSGLKVDMAKAYDCIEWCFLLEVLQRFGFSPKAIALVKAYITTISISIKINGD